MVKCGRLLVVVVKTWSRKHRGKTIYLRSVRCPAVDDGLRAAGGADHLAYVKGELFMEEARQLVKEYLPESYFVVDAVTLCHQGLTDKGRIFAVET